MKFHNITKDDMLNGDGLRVVLWVSGCDHHCVHCQNPITWDINDGVVFDDAAKEELFSELKKDYISGVTFSGGDPLHLKNRDEILQLAKEIKETFPDKTIWLYTGYQWEEVKDLNGIEYLDVLADGKFIEELADPLIEWVGSANQRVIDVPQSLKSGEIVLWKVVRKAFHSKSKEKE
jgi:anaerobic ribonucleoside-triphosphate reductase activating protein